MDIAYQQQGKLVCEGGAVSVILFSHVVVWEREGGSNSSIGPEPIAQEHCLFPSQLLLLMTTDRYVHGHVFVRTAAAGDSVVIPITQRKTERRRSNKFVAVSVNTHMYTAPPVQ